MAFPVAESEAVHLQFPLHAGHHIHRIGTANADSHHAQTTGVRSMGIGAYHHAARKSVVFQYDLMNDACSGLPKADAVTGRDIPKKTIDFLVGFGSGGNVFFGSFICLNQMVAMYG